MSKQMDAVWRPHDRRATASAEILSEAEFHSRADSFLEGLESALEEIYDLTDDGEVINSVSQQATGEVPACLNCAAELLLHAVTDEAIVRAWPQQGIITLNLGAKGTFVINKQTPNRQIWWSSPISGPRRFHLDDTQSNWVSTRNGEELMTVLEQELQQLLGSEFRFADDESRT